MDDQNRTPSDTPDYQAKRDQVAAHRVPPGAEPAEPQPADAPPAEPLPFSDEPVQASDDTVPVLEASPDTDAVIDVTPESPEPPADEPDTPATPHDALPGDAAPTPTIPLADERPITTHPQSVIIPADRPVPAATPAVLTQPAARPRGFTFWLLVYLAVWTGAMALTLPHRFDRRMDWNTSYFATAARNLVRDGFVNLRGGMYLLAGEGVDAKQREFYAGHPPMTAWLLAGWMKAFGQSDAAIRALPLTFTVLNLLLLYVLVRRVFGAPAAAATTVICSLLPMTAYYAQVVNMEPFVMTFMLGGAIGYLAWSRSGSTFGFLLLCLCVVLGCWTDWPMYLFTGFLALAHLFKRRDLLVVSPSPGTPGEGRGEGRAGEPEDATPPRPVFAALFLLVLAMAVFAAFLVYLRLNHSGFGELRARATARMAGADHSAAAAYAGLIHKVTHFGELKDWFVGLFTPSALLLAAVGLILWRAWSRRLSLASGEAARRAAFRILACLVLTQLVYTLAFPDGAAVHEFWQYYLTVPIALLVGGLCTWLTVAGGSPRGFFPGLVDRTAWAVAATIPILAIGPVAWRMHLRLPGKSEPRAGDGLYIEFAQPLRQHTGPRDLILTDLPEDDATVGEQRLRGLKKALPWYADRAILTHVGNQPDEHDTHSLGGIRAILAEYPNRKAWYLWDDQGPEPLFEFLNKTYPKHDLPGGGVLYEITTPPAVTPAAPSTAPKPAPTTSAAATTRPVP